jgi:hypothetical protein
VVASPYAIGDYTVDDRFGGDQAISRLRARMHAQGLRLFLDFVPNHMAVDHPWTSKRPELLIQGSEEDLERNPQNFFRVGRDRCAAPPCCLDTPRPSPRTDRTRLVPLPVLTGHVSSLSPY